MRTVLMTLVFSSIISMSLCDGSPALAKEEYTQSGTGWCIGEQQCLMLAKHRAKRNGGLLTIRLGNGNVVKFENSPRDCEAQENEDGPDVVCHTYDLSYFNPKREMFVVTDRTGGDYSILFSSKTGKHIVNTRGFVSVSPRGDRIAFVGSNSEAQIYQFSIVQLTKKKGTEAFTFSNMDDASHGSGDAMERSAAGLGWHGNDDFALAVSFQGGSPKTADAIYKGDKWHYQRPWLTN